MESEMPSGGMMGGLAGKRAGYVSGKSVSAWEQGYALGKIWRSSEILRAAGFSHTDVDFNWSGMTSCQVGMPDSCGARPRMGSCKARRRSRLLITLRPWRNDAFSEAAEAGNRTGRKSERRG